jgi:SAM-dependent methyltransferase
VTDTSGPFDEFPYLAFPIEWTAPERLAIASAFNGGPRTAPLTGRVLELGCANGANLLAMAWYRRDAHFVGIDGSARQVETAEQCRKHLKLKNLEFSHADFRTAINVLEGQFDFIISHGVVSWVTDEARHALFDLCKKCLAPGGLLYLNYNTRPGWDIRGLVRQFLLEHTADAGGLEARAEKCKDLSTRVIGPLTEIGHHYTQLMANEFHLVARGQPAYLAHEYLAPENQAWWRSEFMQMIQQHELDHVADADFNSITNRSTAQLTAMMSQQGMTQAQVNDAVDLLCYRQMHSPIMTHTGFEYRAQGETEFASMLLASSMAPSGETKDGVTDFKHPTGYEIEVSDDNIRQALLKLLPLWPRSLPASELFSDVEKKGAPGDRRTDALQPDRDALHRTRRFRCRPGAPEPVGGRDARPRDLAIPRDPPC